MIAIVNRGGDKNGICKYSLQVNNKILTTFKHNRKDGLSTCLRKAADAYDKYQNILIQEFLETQNSFEDNKK